MLVKASTTSRKEPRTAAVTGGAMIVVSFMILAHLL
jgi:hypothetical protein